MKISFKIAIIIFIIIFNPQKLIASEKIKIGLLVPLSGNSKEIGNIIIKDK